MIALASGAVTGLTLAAVLTAAAVIAGAATRYGNRP